MDNKKLGYDEVADTIGDAIEVITAFESRLSDGFQFTDLFQVVDEWPTLMEIYKDRRVFFEQFKDLDAAESTAVIDIVADRVGQDSGWVADKALRVLNLASFLYETVDIALTRFDYVTDEVKLIFEGQNA